MPWRKTKSVEEIQQYTKLYKLFTGVSGLMGFYAFARAVEGDIVTAVFSGIITFSCAILAHNYYRRSKEW